MSIDYTKMKLPELKEAAKKLGIGKVYQFKKTELVKLLTDIQERQENKEKKKLEEKEAEGVGEKSKVQKSTKAKNTKKEKTAKSNKKPAATKSNDEKTVEKTSETSNEGKKTSSQNKKKNTNKNTKLNQKQASAQGAGQGQNVKQNPNQNKKKSNKNTHMRGASNEECYGLLEVLPDGFAFIRSDNYMPGDNDVYVSPAQVKRFNLRTGDMIKGLLKIKKEGEKFRAIYQVLEVNGAEAKPYTRRVAFEDLTPIFPNERLHLETRPEAFAPRLIDFIAPIGKGQRGMIVAPPKTGKTTLLKQVANSICQNHPDVHLIVLLIDERPEEVTDIKRSIKGENVEVIYSTFDELPEHHKRVTEMCLARSKRLVEQGKDLVILLDSITRLSRAYNLIIPPSGRTLSGGLDPAALYMPKKFFGAARNIEEGGSLTVIATALIETGSKMDEVIFEEFKGTGNMELVLDRSLAERRLFPAIDMMKSSTRRDDLLYTEKEMEAIKKLRRVSRDMKAEDIMEGMIRTFMKTKTNDEYINVLMTRILANY